MLYDQDQDQDEEVVTRGGLPEEFGSSNRDFAYGPSDRDRAYSLVPVIFFWGFVLAALILCLITTANDKWLGFSWFVLFVSWILFRSLSFLYALPERAKHRRTR